MPNNGGNRATTHFANRQVATGGYDGDIEPGKGPAAPFLRRRSVNMTSSRPEKKDRQTRNRDIALFRYGLIAPLLFAPPPASWKRRCGRWRPKRTTFPTRNDGGSASPPCAAIWPCTSRVALKPCPQGSGRTKAALKRSRPTFWKRPSPCVRNSRHGRRRCWWNSSSATPVLNWTSRSTPTP